MPIESNGEPIYEFGEPTCDIGDGELGGGGDGNCNGNGNDDDDLDDDLDDVNNGDVGGGGGLPILLNI